MVPPRHSFLFHCLVANDRFYIFLFFSCLSFSFLTHLLSLYFLSLPDIQTMVGDDSSTSLPLVWRKLSLIPRHRYVHGSLIDPLACVFSAMMESKYLLLLTYKDDELHIHQDHWAFYSHISILWFLFCISPRSFVSFPVSCDLFCFRLRWRAISLSTCRLMAKPPCAALC